MRRKRSKGNFPLECIKKIAQTGKKEKNTLDEGGFFRYNYITIGKSDVCESNIVLINGGFDLQQGVVLVSTGVLKLVKLSAVWDCVKDSQSKYKR